MSLRLPRQFHGQREQQQPPRTEVSDSLKSCRAASLMCREQQVMQGEGERQNQGHHAGQRVTGAVDGGKHGEPHADEQQDCRRANLRPGPEPGKPFEDEHRDRDEQQPVRCMQRAGSEAIDLVEPGAEPPEHGPDEWQQRRQIEPAAHDALILQRAQLARRKQSGKRKDERTEHGIVRHRQTMDQGVPAQQQGNTGDQLHGQTGSLRQSTPLAHAEPQHGRCLRPPRKPK